MKAQIISKANNINSKKERRPCTKLQIAGLGLAVVTCFVGSGGRRIMTLLAVVTCFVALVELPSGGRRIMTLNGGQHGDVRKEGIALVPQDATNNFTGILARAFDPWPIQQHPLPCFLTSEESSSWRGLQRTPSDQGFLFLKPYKTGSSTVSGINLRIARNVARKQQREEDGASTPNIKFTRDAAMCKARSDHGPWKFSAANMYANRIRHQSFLWTVIREPTARMISMFFHFAVSREKMEPTDKNFQEYLQKNVKTFEPGYYLQSLSTKVFNNEKDDPIDFANKILNEYDFIGITERMDESAVVLMMLLNLSMADVLYMSAKSAGGYDAQKKCTYIWPSFVTPGMENYFQSDKWQKATRLEVEFYKAANRSLDLTIDKLGRSQFEAHLTKFRQILRVIQEECVPKAVFPCSSLGWNKKTDCLWKDSGCGTTCLDELSTKMNLW